MGVVDEDVWEFTSPHAAPTSKTTRTARALKVWWMPEQGHLGALSRRTIEKICFCRLSILVTPITKLAAYNRARVCREYLLDDTELRSEPLRLVGRMIWAGPVETKGRVGQDRDR